MPVGPEHEIQLVMAEQHGAWVTVRHGDSEMQVQAFAAARRAALWDDVRAEIASGGRRARAGMLRRSRGRSAPSSSPRYPPSPGSPPPDCGWSGSSAWTALAGSCAACSPARPRAAASPPALLEEVFRDVVVVRGEHPVPPRDILELRLPPEAQKAFEEQAAAAEENRFQAGLNPFERGPEFTETR